MAIEIVDFPIKNGGSFHCYVSLPEGNSILWHLFGIGSGIGPEQKSSPQNAAGCCQDPLGAMTQIWWAERLIGHWVAHWKIPSGFSSISGIEYGHELGHGTVHFWRIRHELGKSAGPSEAFDNDFLYSFEKSNWRTLECQICWLHLPFWWLKPSSWLDPSFLNS